jgi:hypothetical protein
MTPCAAQQCSPRVEAEGLRLGNRKGRVREFIVAVV